MELQFSFLNALKIIAIEPIEENFKLLKRNMERYCPTAYMMQAAISNRGTKSNVNDRVGINSGREEGEQSSTRSCGSVHSTSSSCVYEEHSSSSEDPGSHTTTMTYFPRMPGNSCLSSFSSEKLKRQILHKTVIPFTKGMKEESCVVKTLSEVIEGYDSLGKSRISLLKIDVEGSELDVLHSIDDRQWHLIDQIVIETEKPPVRLATSIPYSYSNIHQTSMARHRAEDGTETSVVGETKSVGVVEGECKSACAGLTGRPLNDICTLLESKGFRVHVDWDPALGCEEVVLVFAFCEDCKERFH